MAIIAGLTLLLLIPTSYVESLISERNARRSDAAQEVSQRWGGTQTLTGPILTIPYTEYSKNDKGIPVSSTHYAHFLPASLGIRSQLNPEVRYRGIYRVALYRGKFNLEGHFARPDWDALRIDPRLVQWNDAVITMGITDLKGIRDTVILRWNALTYPSRPGLLCDDVVGSGISFKPAVGKTESNYAFDIALDLNGSTEIRFVPVGEVTEVDLASPWASPSFVGNFLPHVREVKPDGFHAVWKIFNLNRSFPQSWVGNRYNVSEASFGTSLFLPVDEYQKTSRSVKYALLFIALTFIAFFLSELVIKIAFHPIQYTLIGFALILFYLLLLSLSEHIGFNLAYLFAGAATISLVTLYTFWISAKRQIGAIMFLVLSMLFGFLFVTLQLQDYALLLGSLGLFAALSLTMYLTRKVNWFSVNPAQE